jgi:hypothetical protein
MIDVKRQKPSREEPIKKPIRTNAKLGFEALRSAGVIGAFFSFRIFFCPPSVFFLNAFLSFPSFFSFTSTTPRSFLSFATASDRDLGANAFCNVDA